LFANFNGGTGKTDTDCIYGTITTCFPADTYDLSSEYSRVAYISSFNLTVGGTIILSKLKVNLNPFIVVSTGKPFNIVTGRDTNGDGLFTERPSFATALTDPANLRQTRFGDFDLAPAPGQALIPRNYGMGPSFFSVNLGISRSFKFGNVPARTAVAAAKTAAPGGAQPAAKAPAPAASGASGPASGPAPEKRYTVTFSVNIQNLLNSTNLSQPIGNLSSPQFGESISTVGNFGVGSGGSPAAGNRRIQFQVRIGL
jgi:hypothetical protein